MTSSGTWPDGIAVRALDKADVEAWATLLADAERVDQFDENYDVEDLLEELGDPSLDLANDTVALWSGDRMVGFASVHSPPSVLDVARFRSEGVVHPDWRRRGLGTRLVVWIKGRAAELRAERYADWPARVGMGGKSDDEARRALAEGAGFRAERWFFDMRRDLTTEPVPPASCPDGAELVLFDPTYDEATLDAHNEAFLDHWGFAPRTLEYWHTRATRSRAFRSGLSSLLVVGDRVVAYALAYEYEADTGVTGVRDCYLGQIGTRPDWRGRGAAGALITNTLTVARAAGYDRASLGVDATNPTGALGLYERLGFRTFLRVTAYTHDLD